MSTIFGDFDISDFWEVSEYANESYVDSPLTDDVVREIELRQDLRNWHRAIAFLLVLMYCIKEDIFH
jgi:hypothetical protein